ncbi:hypothetical protein CesoFtcFv8_017349 [Champsocephalus esox]|uniref:Uncharacterized protein n=2 Tax=Champsocephalus TaxID=52236 RepID=A0AAN8BK50_9TELE|nr:hypothetical protein CesoFtcFv8_017349 [Champsocephalus esox]
MLARYGLMFCFDIQPRKTHESKHRHSSDQAQGHFGRGWGGRHNKRKWYGIWDNEIHLTLPKGITSPILGFTNSSSNQATYFTDMIHTPLCQNYTTAPLRQDPAAMSSLYFICLPTLE